MARFYAPIDARASVGARLELSESDTRHAVRVLRLREGSRIDLLDGLGKTARCRLVDTSAKLAVAELLELTETPRPDLEITVFQAAIKPKGMDWAIQKLCELGVHQVIPFVCQNCEARFTDKNAEDKRLKWSRVAEETLKQCGGPWLTDVHPVLSFDAALGLAEDRFDAQFVADLEQGPGRLRLDASAMETRPLRVAIWIGPEGDLTRSEIDRVRQCGATSISLGETTLRSESAAVVAVATLAHEYDRERERLRAGGGSVE